MKKFGTPSGAAPGWANENVGFAAVGAPVAPGVVALGVVVVVPAPLPLFAPRLRLPLCLPLPLLGLFACVLVVVVPGWLCVEVVCFFPGRVGCGAVCAEVVEVEVEVEREVVVELVREGEVEVKLHVVVGLEVVVAVDVAVRLDVVLELLVVDVVSGGGEALVDDDVEVVVDVSVGHDTLTTLSPFGS